MYDNEENTSIDEELDILLDDFVLDEDDDFDLDSELDRVLNEAEEDETGGQEGGEDSGQQAQEGQNTEGSDGKAQEEDQTQEDGEDSEGGTDDTEGEEGSAEDGTDGEDVEGGDGSEEDPEAAAEEASENKEKQYYFEVFSDLYDNVKLFVEKTADLMESYTEEDNKTLFISIQDELYNLKQDLELLLIEKIKIMPLENLNIVYVSISSKVKILLDIIEKISSSEVKKV